MERLPHKIADRAVQRNFDDLLGRVRTARVSTGSVASGARANVTVTWDEPFKDTSYTVEAVAHETFDGPTIRVLKVMTIAKDSVVVKVQNDDPAFARTGDVHVFAIHD